MRKFMFRLWPPYAFFVSERSLGKRHILDTWADEFDKAMKTVDLLVEDQFDAAEQLASATFESEMRRKDVLEAKAATFVVTPAIAVSIASGIAALSRDLHLSRAAASLTIICYSLAVIHFLVSAYYAIAARSAEEFVVLASANAQDLLTRSRPERIAARLAYASVNEPALVRKVNRLTVAEGMFLRGLAFLAVASLLTLLGYLFVV